MNTINRTVTPAWGKDSNGDTRNLGAHALNGLGFTPDSLAAFVKDYPEAAISMMDNQVNIGCIKAEISRRIVSFFPEGERQQKDEKQAVFYDRTFRLAEAAMKEVAKQEFDYPAIARNWAENERKTPSDKRTVLEGYDKVISAIETQWAGMNAEGRGKALAKLQLADVTVESDKDAVVKAISVKYKPAVVVKTENLFA